MKEKIAVIRKAIDALEDNDAKKELTDTLNSVEQFIQTAETEKSKYEDLQAQLSQLESEKANAERDMMKYKSIQKKATEQMTEMETELEKVKGSYKDYDTLKAENENLKHLKVEQDKQKRADYEKVINALKERPNFSNFEDALVLPTDENPLDNIDIEAIDKSLGQIEDWKKRGFIEIEKDTHTKPAVTPTEQPTKMDGILDHVFGKS